MFKPRTFCQSDPRFVGDPIDVTTGANTDVITDIARRGPLPLRWTRYYNSARSNVHCSLGWGHAHRFDRVLIRDLDGLRYEDPLGRVVTFREPAHIDLPVRASGWELTWTEVDSYVIAQPDKPHQLFQFTPRSQTARLVRLWQDGLSIDLRYTDAGVLREIVDSWGRVIVVSSDAAGRVVRLALLDAQNAHEESVLLVYEYDRAGNLIRAVDRHQTTLAFSYDGANRMTRRTDRRGYSFHFEYDEQGRCVHSRGDDGLLEVWLDYRPDARLTFVRRGDGGQWIYAYNDSNTITQITDPYGHATRFILDEMGRPAQEIDPNGNVTILHYDWRGKHDYRIDPNGYLLPPRDADPSPKDPLGYELPTTALEWELGRLVDAKDIQPPEPNDPLLFQFPQAVSDAVTNRVAASGPQATSDVRVKTSNDLLYTDDFGRPLGYVSPRFTEKWSYDANRNLVEHRDRDGSISRWGYSSWNALTQRIDALGHATSFELTVQGLMAKITDPGGTVTEYTYDLCERLIEVRETGAAVERYRRDPAGNIVERTDPAGRSLVRWEVGPGNLDKVRVLSSGEKHLFEHDARGRIVKAHTPAGVATFLYDESGVLLVDQRDGLGVVHEVEFKQLTATTYFDKFRVNYRTLDNGDYVVEDPVGAQHRFQIGRAGLVVKHLANGSLELSQFDAAGRCRRKALLRYPHDNAFWMRGYGYSPGGDLVVAADTRRGTTEYGYDAAHRLIEERRPDGVQRRFAYDAAGNLVTQPGLGRVTIGGRNRLQEVNGATCSYNERCHLADVSGAVGRMHFEYNEMDLLVRCDVNGEPWTASYDGLCRRTQKTWRGKTTTYYWDNFRLAAEVQHDGSCRLYIYADNIALTPFLFIDYDSVDSPPESGRRYYVFTDQIGAPIRVDDEAGRAVWSGWLDPYGKLSVDPGSTIELHLRFPGHYFDPETGLHHNRFRSFSPELGRYLQSDPAGLAGGINPYAYPSQPLTVVDIDGLGAKDAKASGCKARDGSEPSVGCEIVLPKGLSDEEVRAALKAKTDRLIDDIKKIQPPPPPPTHVIAPDGTKLEIYPNLSPCISAAYDKKTGGVTYGQNRDERPQPMNPTLADNADAAGRFNKERGSAGTGMPPEGLANKGIPGHHSEVNAVNEGMKKRPDSKPDDFVVYNQNPDSGTPMECCRNCKITLGKKVDEDKTTKDKVVFVPGTGATDVSKETK
jgi:RHS repeat-associated protein